MSRKEEAQRPVFPMQLYIYIYIYISLFSSVLSILFSVLNVLKFISIQYNQFDIELERSCCRELWCRVTEESIVKGHTLLVQRIVK